MNQVYVVFISALTSSTTTKIGIDVFICANINKAIEVAEIPRIDGEKIDFINNAIKARGEYFEIVNNKSIQIRLEDVLQ